MTCYIVHHNIVDTYSNIQINIYSTTQLFFNGSDFKFTSLSRRPIYSIFLLPSTAAEGEIVSKYKATTKFSTADMLNEANCLRPRSRLRPEP